MVDLEEQSPVVRQEEVATSGSQVKSAVLPLPQHESSTANNTKELPDPESAGDIRAPSAKTNVQNVNTGIESIQNSSSSSVKSKEADSAATAQSSIGQKTAQATATRSSSTPDNTATTDGDPTTAEETYVSIEYVHTVCMLEKQLFKRRQPTKDFVKLFCKCIQQVNV